jgi:hypothetical protein
MYHLGMPLVIVVDLVSVERIDCPCAMGLFCEIFDSGKLVVCAGDVLIMRCLLLEPQ